MNPKLKIGVVGCAAIANKSVIPAIKLLNQFELIAVASRTKRKAVEFGHQFNCEAIFGYQNIIYLIHTMELENSLKSYLSQSV